MATASQARAAIRLRLEQGAIVDSASAAVALRWQNEEADSTGQVELPDVPAPFVYTEILIGRGSLAGYGSGRGGNLYRNPIEVNAFVFVPRGVGLDAAEAIAEQIAVLLRSHRDSTVSLFDATVQPGGDGADLKPPGLSSEVGNYFVVVVDATGFFDQIG